MAIDACNQRVEATKIYLYKIERFIESSTEIIDYSIDDLIAMKTDKIYYTRIIRILILQKLFHN